MMWVEGRIKRTFTAILSHKCIHLRTSSYSTVCTGSVYLSVKMNSIVTVNHVKSNSPSALQFVLLIKINVTVICIARIF